MHLMDCPDCGKEISTSAKLCPNCGCKITQEMVTRYERDFKRAIRNMQEKEKREGEKRRRKEKKNGKILDIQ